MPPPRQSHTYKNPGPCLGHSSDPRQSAIAGAPLPEIAPDGIPPEQEFHSIPNVAAMFGVTTRTVRNWINHKNLRPSPGDGPRFISRAAIDAFLTQKGSRDEP